MNLIFLDIDGVLVTARTRWNEADQQCVTALNRIIRTASTGIVVSSCWRVGREVIELRELLLGWGVIAKVIDRTGEMRGSRGEEINVWLEAYSREVEKFVILDDDADMAHLVDRLVRTKSDVGLTEADADRAIRMLL